MCSQKDSIISYHWVALIGESSGAQYCSVQCTVCSVQCAVCSVQCAVCSVQRVRSVQCAVCSVQCAVCSVQCAVCSVQCAVCSSVQSQCGVSSSYLSALTLKEMVAGALTSTPGSMLSTIVFSSSTESGFECSGAQGSLLFR